MITFSVRGSERNVSLSRPHSWIDRLPSIHCRVQSSCKVQLLHTNRTYSRFQLHNGTVTLRPVTANNIVLWLRDSRGTATRDCACTCWGWGWGLHVAGFWQLMVVGFIPEPSLRRNAVRGKVITFRSYAWLQSKFRPMVWWSPSSWRPVQMPVYS